MLHKPAVAGMFYDSEKKELIQSIEQCFLSNFGPGKLPDINNISDDRQIVGLVCPHAGYMYSGQAAAFSYSALAKDGLPDTVVLLGPNHNGLGNAVAISSADEWITPLGAMQVDTDTADSILKSSKYAEIDESAHFREHSIEVQLPFLQYIGSDKIKIVPISITHLNESDALELISDLGSAIAKALDGKNAVIIASTDFTHYESKANAAIKDTLAMDRILDLNAEGLIQTVYEQSITMCGVTGTAVMIEACTALGATAAHKLTYYTSGDIIGDTSEVVGYGALSIVKE